MKKQRINTLVVIDNLHAGGVATSLYNYLKYTQEKQHCDLLVFNEESIDLNRLPHDVTVLKTQKILHVLGKFHSEIKKESFFYTILRLIMIFIARGINGVAARKIIWPFVSRIGDYDFAIAYAQDDGWKSISKGCIDFVVEKVNAKKKAVIVHCDYINFGGYNINQQNMFNKLDFIINVSKSCKSSFDKCFQNLQNKSIVCENFIDIDYVINKSTPAITYNKEVLTFVSVCRLSEEKGLDRAIRAFGRIKKDGFCRFCWIIVGEGPERLNLETLIYEKNLTNNISLVGIKENPYPYIKNASWFLLPSRHEAAPMVFGESAVLGVPIITTATCSAKEMVEERNLGVVVDNDEDSIYFGLLSIINRDINTLLSVDSNDVNKQAILDYQKFINLIEIDET